MSADSVEYPVLSSWRQPEVSEDVHLLVAARAAGLAGLEVAYVVPESRVGVTEYDRAGEQVEALVPLQEQPTLPVYSLTSMGNSYESPDGVIITSTAAEAAAKRGDIVLVNPREGSRSES